MSTFTLFSIINAAILMAWLPLIFAPRTGLTQKILDFPYIPFVLSFFYVYFLILVGGLAEADFSSLEGILALYHQATPEAAAAGWMHYLAFDYWVGCWVLRDAQAKNIPQSLLALIG